MKYTSDKRRAGAPNVNMENPLNVKLTQQTIKPFLIQSYQGNRFFLCHVLQQ